MGACLLTLLLTGCAGPMTPFGAANSIHRIPEDEAESSTAKLDPHIEFYPKRQVLHTANPFTIEIQDKKGVPEKFLFRITYNNIDVTREFMSKAEKTFVDSAHKKMRLTTRGLRLIPQRDNTIKVTYAHSASDWPVVSQYQSPRCSAFDKKRKLVFIPDFEVNHSLIQYIDQYSQEKKFNPFYVAGLIAQESAFDPKAISRSRAMGLTQVTPLGDAEIAKRYSEWPRYPGIGSMTWMQMKFGVLNGRINSRNDWRLNEQYSVLGGVEYLRYLTEYWTQPERRAFIRKYAGSSETALSEIILASYNSGATRVSSALENHGRRWLQDDDLNEARRYVRRVASYCDYFENGGRQ